MIRVLGVDPAARRDRFAVAVVHAEPGRCEIVHVEAATGLDYEQMAPVVLDFLADEDRRARRDDALGCAIDATGIGAAPAEALHKALTRVSGGKPATGLSRPVAFRGVVLTGGSGESAGTRPYLHNASRELLIGNLVLAMRTGAVVASDLEPEARTLLGREMATFTQRTLPSGKVRMAHNATGHDDVLWACALGAWLARTLAGHVVAVGLPRGEIRGATRPREGRLTSPMESYSRARHLVAARKRHAAEPPAPLPTLPPELRNRFR